MLLLWLWRQTNPKVIDHSCSCHPREILKTFARPVVLSRYNKCLSWRCDVTRGLPLRDLSFVLPVCRRRINTLEMVIPDTLKWSATTWWVIQSSLNHTHRSLTVILIMPWNRRSCEHSHFRNGTLFTFVDSTINDRRWF